MTDKNLPEFPHHFNVITGFAMRKNLLNIGIVGLDTSHVEAFTGILNNSRDPHRVEGGTINGRVPGRFARFSAESLSCRSIYGSPAR